MGMGDRLRDAIRGAGDSLSGHLGPAPMNAGAYLAVFLRRHKLPTL